jgi:methyl-accepting chemotaxis protein
MQNVYSFLAKLFLSPLYLFISTPVRLQLNRTLSNIERFTLRAVYALCHLSKTERDYELIKNFTIRRVVLCILLTAFALITATGGYAAYTAHNMNKYAEQSAAQTQQALFLAHATLVLQHGTDAEKQALKNEIPAGPEWATLSQALSDTSANWQTEATARIKDLTQHAVFDSALNSSDGKRLNIVLLIALFALGGLVLFCDCYLVIHLVKPVGDIRSYFQVIAQGDLTREPKDIGRNCVGQMIPLVREMQHSLLKTVTAISENSDALHREASEIAAGNSDLANRTTRQAALWNRRRRVWKS